MGLGPFVRRMFGPYEHRITELYRNFFVDLDEFADRLKIWVPEPARILEVGCGEGALTERLVGIYPDARITAVDISPRVGRLFRGDTKRVSFLNQPIERLIRDRPKAFDLIVLCDVLHHVAVAVRRQFLASIGEAMAPEAYLVLKDWEPSFTAIHLTWFLADRFVTGDRVSFWTEAEIRGWLEEGLGSGCVRAQARIRPRWNNLAFLVRPPADWRGVRKIGKTSTQPENSHSRWNAETTTWRIPGSQ